MVSEANEPASESGKRSDDRRGAARGTRDTKAMRPHWICDDEATKPTVSLQQ